MGMREAYQEKAHAQLCEWQAWIDRYKAGPAAFDAQKGIERQRMLQRMEDCQRLACTRLNELRAAHEERWEAAKQAVEQAMIDLKRALDEGGAGQAAHVLVLQAGCGDVYQPFPKRG